MAISPTMLAFPVNEDGSEFTDNFVRVLALHATVAVKTFYRRGIEQQVCDRDPVVTRCKHYFCETCALRHNSLNKGKCAICEQPTNGIFNVANDIIKKVKEQKKKEAEES